MRIIILSLLIMVTGISFSQETVFEAPKKVIKNSNFMYTIFIEDSIEYDKDNSKNSLYIYIQDAIVDTIYDVDSLNNLDEYGNVVKYAHETPYLSITSGNIFLVDSSGNLIYRKALEDLKLPVKKNKLNLIVDIITQKELFVGYKKMEYIVMKNLRFSHETMDTAALLMIGIDEINFDKFPYIYIKRKDKWGIIDFDGSIIEKPEYYEIIRGTKGIELYNKKGILEKVIELPQN